MSRRRKILIYALPVAALIGLVALLMISGLDDASKWAGVLALFVGLATLGLALYEMVGRRVPAPTPQAPVPAPTPEPPTPPLPAPAPSPVPSAERRPPIDAPPPTTSSTSPVARSESILKAYARLHARHLDGFRGALRKLAKGG